MDEEAAAVVGIRPDAGVSGSAEALEQRHLPPFRSLVAT